LPYYFSVEEKVSLFSVFSFLISNGSRKTKLIVLKNTGTVNFELVANAVLENTKAKFKEQLQS